MKALNLGPGLKIMDLLQGCDRVLVTERPCASNGDGEDIAAEGGKYLGT